MSLNILAVDDSKTMRDLLHAALAPQGFDVSLAEDGVHGLETLKEMTPPDVIITDINMPKLDGFGFIEGVREQQNYRGTPILVLTTESAPELKMRARDAGATGWIVKPFDKDKLIAAIRRVAN
ncbi:response regulator [Amaricoccus tamworthensis]|uniref:response regulator n=1 Tax=Amaricoccus tamworthensis TaxID=57002 RepID=UPI003C7CB9EA